MFDVSVEESIEMMKDVYYSVVNWLEIDEENVWDMGDMIGLDVIGELNEKELVEELKNLREEIEVMRRVLKNVEEIEEVYYKEYLKRREE